MDTPASLLEELLRFRQSSIESTAEFQKYNHDDICRKISDHLHTLLDSFEKYHHITYVVQGPRDQGVDVLMKGSKKDEPENYVALQIKSYAEIADRDSDLSKQLKAGLHDAKSAYGEGLRRYYILLFGDAGKHSKRISAITNEFVKDKDVRVIGPRDLFTFLSFSSNTLCAVIDRRLSDDDCVRKEALKEVFGYSESQIHFILTCLCWAFENSSAEMPEDFFDRSPHIRRYLEKYGADKLRQEMSQFEDKDFEAISGTGAWTIRLEHYRGIRALYFDFQVRYDEKESILFDHLFEFLRLDITG